MKRIDVPLLMCFMGLCFLALAGLAHVARQSHRLSLPITPAAREQLRVAEGSTSMILSVENGEIVAVVCK